MNCLSEVVNQTLSGGWFTDVRGVPLSRTNPKITGRCSKNHVPCGEQSAGPVLTTKVAFVPALRSGQETSSAATWPRSEWDAVEPFRVYWRPTNGWARGASTLRDGAILV